MKKNILILTIALVALAAAAADSGAEDGPFRRGFDIVAGTTMEASRSGGYGGIGFPIIRKDTFEMRNELTFHGLGGSGAGYMMLSEKITFGGFLDRGSVAFRPYGMISAAFGFYSTAGKELFSDPFALDFLGGGGFDIYYSKTSAFFVEYGGGFLWLPGTTDADAVSSTGKAFITLGTKVFLN